jgi:serine phosphatase RsbU (regulator of sigma subunit)
VRVRPYTRYAAALTLALAASCAGATNAGALSVAGIQLPHVPTVSVPQVSGAPAPVNDVVGTVNGVTSGATGTVNNTVDTVNNAVRDPAGTVGGVTSNPPTGAVAPKTNTSQGGAGSGSGSTGASTGSGSTLSPTARGGSGQASTPRAVAGRRSARRARRAAARRAAAHRVATRPVAAATTNAAASSSSHPASSSRSSDPVARVISRIERVIPGPVKILIGVLALAALAFAVQSWLAGRRARRLERQRTELLGDVGLLQRALLPDVPQTLRGIDASVAYRPAEGPAAGGDFYDVFELDGGRTAIIVGDVCGHGRAALAVTALMRYTLRAYVAAGFAPRVALQVAGRALDGNPDGALTTVVLAIYDPADGTLTYACAGHEPPIVLGPATYEPVTAFSSPPLGGFMPTGQRQTTVPLPPSSLVCFFTDGLVEARLGDDMIGRGRLTELLRDLEPDCGAQLLLERLAASADRAPDDMAACLVRATGDAVAVEAAGVRVEELEADTGELSGERVGEFLAACGVKPEAAVEALRAARLRASEFGGAELRVSIDESGATVDVRPREPATLPVPSLEDARRRASLEVPAL